MTIFGSKRSLFVSIGLNLIGSLCFLHAEGYVGLFCGAFIIGLNDHFVYIMLKIIMNELFGDAFTHYLPMSYAGFAFSPLIWPNLISYFVNPDNVQPSDVYIEGGVEVMYFGKEIVDNFQFFLKLQMILHFVLLFSASIFLPKPSDDHSRFSQFVEYLKQGKFRQASIIYRESRMMVDKKLNRMMKEAERNVSHQYSIGVFSRTFRVASSFKHTTLAEPMVLPSRAPSIRKMVHRSHHHKHEPYDYVSGSDEFELRPLPKLSADYILDAHPPLNQSKLVYETEDREEALNEDQKLERRAKEIDDYEQEQTAIDESIRSDLFSQLFICLFVVCTIRATTTCYFFSNFKIMGMYYFNDDMLINTVGSIAYIGYIIVSFTFGNIFDALGLRKGFILMLGSLVIINLVYASFTSRITAYFALSVVHRVDLLVL